ncbi:4'-phosphopantetheinyl transferase family protein [Streptomyces sp. NPDC001135]
MLGPILPAPVVCAEAFRDAPECVLLPEEREVLARIRHEERRREFATVRHCARRALAELGVAPAPLLPDGQGAPCWPQGVVGSMTHTLGYRAAAVAPRSAARAVGIDAEPHAPLPRRVVRGVVRPEERQRLAALHAADPATCWDRLLFCAKEAVYKAWYPMTLRRIGFLDASVDIDRETGAFHAEVHARTPAAGDGGRAAASPRSFTGRWTASPRLLVVAVVVPAPPRHPEPGTRPTS